MNVTFAGVQLFWKTSLWSFFHTWLCSNIQSVACRKLAFLQWQQAANSSHLLCAVSSRFRSVECWRHPELSEPQASPTLLKHPDLTLAFESRRWHSVTEVKAMSKRTMWRHAGLVLYHLTKFQFNLLIDYLSHVSNSFCYSNPPIAQKVHIAFSKTNLGECCSCYVGL